MKDWTHAPNSTAEIEDVILKHMELKEDEVVNQWLIDEGQANASTADDSETPSPTRQAVESFQHFNDITEVHFALSQTSFYPYCEAGTGKKIGVKNIRVMPYSTYDDDSNNDTTRRRAKKEGLLQQPKPQLP